MFELARNLKVFQRLGIGFGLMSVIVAIIAGVSAWNSFRIRQLCREDLVSVQADYAAAASLQSQLQLQEIAIRDFVLVSMTGRDMTGITATWNDAAKLGGTEMAVLQSGHRPAEQDALLRQVKALNSQLSALMQDVVEAVKNFNPDQAVTTLRDRVQPLSAQRSALVNRFAISQKRRAEETTASISAISANSLITVIITGSVSVGCAVLLAWAVGVSIARPLKDVAEAANRLAGGDLTGMLTVVGKDEISALARALSTMTGRLREVIGTMRQTAAETTIASTEIATGNRDLSERTERQAASLQSTASSVAELTEAVRRNADSAKIARELATQAATVAVDGGERVGLVSDTMSDIAKSSDQIAKIVDVIDGIAFQTNILALNAAVEAARAGENGRGFAVVAAEVRALSRRSAEAAKEIRSLMEANAHKVGSGSALVRAAASTMLEIVNSSRKAADLVAEISQVSVEQASSLDTVRQSIARIDEMTQQNAALVEQATAAAESLTEQTHLLNHSVNKFNA